MWMNSVIFLATLSEAKSFSVKLSDERTEQSHTGRLQTIREDLTNFLELSYTAQLKLGTPMQSLPSIGFDTTVGTSRVELDTCATCDGAAFDSASSTSFVADCCSDSRNNTFYDGSIESGDMGTDRICLSEDTSSCTSAWKFYALSEKGSNLSSYHDGMIGMWNGQVTGQDDLLIPKLYQSGAISQSKFSIYMGLGSEESYIDIGEPDNNILESGDVMWVDTDPTSDKWQTEVNGFGWSGNTDGISWGASITHANAYIDTANSCIIGPSETVDHFIQEIKDKASSVTSSSASWGDTIPCSDVDNELLPTFYMTFGSQEHAIEVQPAAYAIPTSLGSDQCFICLTPSSVLNFWVLGSTFIRQWYVIFDYEQNRFGFIRPPRSDLTWWTYLAYGIAYIFPASVFYYLWIQYCSKTSVATNTKSSKKVSTPSDDSVQIIFLRS